MPNQYHFLIYVLGFSAIWFGAGLAIHAVERLSKYLRLSSFAVSFLVLGFFTSISELSVGVNAVVQNDPEIFVGNLVGASILLFLLAIPLLAITGNQVKISREFSGLNLWLSLIVVGLPGVLLFDGHLDLTDAVVATVGYATLLISIQSKKGLLEKVKSWGRFSPRVGLKELGKIGLGFGMVFMASKVVVEQTLYFSQLWDISPFLISLFAISIGTNLPELSLMARSVFAKSNQVAFGDYVGSAAFNTFLLGFLAFWYGKPIAMVNSYRFSLITMAVGLVLFYWFARTKNTLSRWEALVLVAVYFAFLGLEIVTHS